MLNNLMAKCEIKGGLNLLSSNVNIELGFFYVRELRGYRGVCQSIALQTSPNDGRNRLRDGADVCVPKLGSMRARKKCPDVPCSIVV